MKRLVAVTAVLSVLCVCFSCAAEGAKQVTYVSDKPVYAKVALTEDGSKVLSVVLDESQGTGKGYDLLYADVDFSGRFEETEKLAPVVPVRTAGIRAYFRSFPAIKLNVPYNDKAKGASNPCEVNLTYRKLPPRTGATASVPPTGGVPSSPAVASTEYFDVLMTVRLRDDSATWEYSFTGTMKPAESPEKAPVWSLSLPPKLNIATQPDGKNIGKLGIELKTLAGEVPLECKKSGEPIKAHVEIKRPDGKVVHRGEDFVGKFYFG